jgi:hypothetical protein
MVRSNFPRARARTALIAVAFVAIVSAVGCAHVAPYEREHLAKPNMDVKREELRNRFYAHVYDAREGAMGNTDSAGGGCGCN